MKARLKTRITINADAAAVFKYLGDTSHHRLWNPRLQRVDPEGRLSAGAVYTTQSKILGARIKAENHVTKYVVDEELEVQNKTGMVKYSVNYRLVPVEKGTRLICTTVVSSEGKAFAFAKPMMEQLARRELNADLRELKKTVEQGQG
jgi:carbon monoxide dehydrogenase subunit G